MLVVYWALTIASVVFAQEYGVIQAFDNDFESKVFGKLGKYSLVNFYSPNCQHCLNLRPNWTPLGQLYNNTDLQIVQINALESKRVRLKYQIIGFPTIKLYSSDGEQVAAFSHRGERNTENLITFMEDYTGIKCNEYVTPVKYVSTPDELYLIDNEEKLILFTAPWNKEFTNKYNNIFIDNSRIFNNVNFIVVDTSKPELSELGSLFLIDKFPTLVYQNGENYEKLYKINDYNLKLILNGEDVGQLPFKLNEFKDDEIDEEDEDISIEEMRKHRDL